MGILYFSTPAIGFVTSILLILGSLAGTIATIVIRRFPPMPVGGGPVDQ